MNRQTIKIRRVGSVTFGAMLVIFGCLLMALTFFPKIDFLMVYKFWPVALISLGVEILLSTRERQYEILDESGKVVEQSKIVYDIPAILLVFVVLGVTMLVAVTYWIYQQQGYIYY